MFNRGFTLIEFLVASLIGSFLLLSLVKVYLKLRCSDRWELVLADMQERGRFASDYLTGKIALAGYQGCVDSDNPVDPSRRIAGESGKNNDTLKVAECMNYQGREQFLWVTYSIANTGRKNGKGDSIYALYEKPSGGSRRELIENVSSLRVKYGVASSDERDVASYVEASAVPDWTRVKSVHLDLSLEGIDESAYRSWPIDISLREYS